jgi:uncharacterized membrane protein
MLAAQTIPGLTSGIIPLALGVWATLLAFGIVPASLDEKKAKQWRNRWASRMKVGGPLLIVFGLGQLAWSYLPG